MSCGQCKHYLKTGETEMTGLCRRHAPVSVPGRTTDRGTVATTPEVNRFYVSEAEFPQVHSDWRCGDYEFSVQRDYKRLQNQCWTARADLSKALRRITFRDKKIKALKKDVRRLTRAIAKLERSD